MNLAAVSSFRLGRLMAAVDLARPAAPCPHEFAPLVAHGSRCVRCGTFVDRRPT